MLHMQMGRGRTTTGMIIASLLHLRKVEAFPVKRTMPAGVPPWFVELCTTSYSKVTLVM